MVSENEYKILSLMWREARPLSRAEILKGTEGRNWNPASIHLILNAMISKHVIKITDENKTYGRTYEPELSYDDFLIQTIHEVIPDKPVRQVFEDCERILDGWKKVGKKAMKTTEGRRKNGTK